jgi:hypothetical protein
MLVQPAIGTRNVVLVLIHSGTLDALSIVVSGGSSTIITIVHILAVGAMLKEINRKMLEW